MLKIQDAGKIVQKVIGLLLLISGLFQLIGKPGDIPTWIALIQGLDPVNLLVSRVQEYGGVIVNWLLILVGSGILIGRDNFRSAWSKRSLFLESIPGAVRPLGDVLPSSTIGASEVDEGSVRGPLVNDGRVFVHIEPRALMQIYRDNIHIQAEKLAGRYLGKWMKLAGTIDDIRAQFDDAYALSLKEFVFPAMAGTVSFEFTTAWKERVEILNKGDLVQIQGRIESISSGSLDLVDCELV